MTPAALIAIAALWIAAGLLIARCCGINQLHTDTTEPTMHQDIAETIAGARWALTQAEHTLHLLATHQIPRAEGRQRLERAFADLDEYAGHIVALSGTLTTPPPYHPASLRTALRHAANGHPHPITAQAIADRACVEKRAALGAAA